MGRRLKRDAEVETTIIGNTAIKKKRIKTTGKKSKEKPNEAEAEIDIKSVTPVPTKRSARRVETLKDDINLECEPKQKRTRGVRKKIERKADKTLEQENSLTDDDMQQTTRTTSKRKSIIKTEISHSSKQTDNCHVSSDESSSESEWEEVETQEQDLDDYKPEIPKEGVEITIDCPDLHLRRRKKKEFDEKEWIRIYINRERKEVQLNVHKTHLLCLLAHGFYVNNILNLETLKGLAFSLLPSDLISMTLKQTNKIDSDGIETIVKWFRNSFSFESEKKIFVDLYENVVDYFETRKCLNGSEYNLMFIVFARCLGFKTRLCVSFYPVSHKAQNLIKKPGSKLKKESPGCSKEGKSVKDTEGSSNVKVKSVKQKLKKTGRVAKKLVKSNAVEDEKDARPQRSVGKVYKISSDESDDDPNDEDFKVHGGDVSDEDFEKPKAIRKNLSMTPKEKSNRKILSSDSGDSSPETVGLETETIVCWAEVYSEPDKQWISIECVNNIVNKPYDVERSVPKPVVYIVAYDNDSHVKDVTKRYCSEYMTSTIRLRADSDWWQETLNPFLSPNSRLDKEEEEKLESLLINKPLPHTVAGFKNHPLYALKRHLLKFEAIYPPDAAPVGFMRGEPVYARECVCQLHSRETWLKEARVVRIGEEPYKIVKARPKWDKMAGVMRTDLPLEVFGFWQTEPYEPPLAVDGKVPRNEYGNVELFKPCMLPRGTVHLQLPGLNRVAKKLGIDCSPAVIGFDGHKGSIHPVFDGFVICEEYKDTILAAWDEEQENARKREEEKREKRIYGNWRKLIRGLLIRERIKLKYDVK